MVGCVPKSPLMLLRTHTRSPYTHVAGQPLLFHFIKCPLYFTIDRFCCAPFKSIHQSKSDRLTQARIP